MAEKINGTADWAPGTLDKTRKNIGEISDKDAAVMAKKLGGEVLYERTTTGGGGAGGASKAGRIVRQAPGGAGGSGIIYANGSNTQIIPEDLTDREPTTFIMALAALEDAIMPEVDEIDLEIKEEDVEMKFTRSS